MEPTLPTPHGSPERGPVLPVGPETPKTSQGPEKQFTPERSVEQEQRSEAGTGDSAPISAPMPSVPLPPAPVAQQSTDGALSNDNPLVAADEDLIEKEWVERAKKVIAETRHDPYEQEKAVSRLQVDYRNKRYGKTIKFQDGK